MASTPVAPQAPTQREQILQLLQAANGGEVPSPQLALISLQYSARIHELRQLGWVIANRTQYVNGQRHGYFRLVSAPAVPIAPSGSPSNSSHEEVA